MASVRISLSLITLALLLTSLLDRVQGCPKNHFGDDCSCSSDLVTFIASEYMENVTATCTNGTWLVEGDGDFNLGSSTWNISFDRINITTNFIAEPEGARIYVSANFSQSPPRAGFISIKPVNRPTINVNLSISLYVIDWNRSSPKNLRVRGLQVMEIPPNRGRIRDGFHVVPLEYLPCWSIPKGTIASTQKVVLGFNMTRHDPCRPANEAWYQGQSTSDLASGVSNVVALYPMHDLNVVLQLVGNVKVFDWRVRRVNRQGYSIFWRLTGDPEKDDEDFLDGLRNFLNEEAHVPMDRMSEGVIIPPPGNSYKRSLSEIFEVSQGNPPSYWSDDWVAEIALDPGPQGYSAYLYFVILGITVFGVSLAVIVVMILSRHKNNGYIALKNPTDEIVSDQDEFM